MLFNQTPNVTSGERVELDDYLGDYQEDEEDDLEDDDCEIVVDTSQKLLALPSTFEGLTKREDDVISGGVPFTSTVKIFYLSLIKMIWLISSRISLQTYHSLHFSF